MALEQVCGLAGDKLSNARRIADPRRGSRRHKQGRFRMSAQPKLMPDVEGLAHQVDPLSRRGFFLTASAAAAAGYTLAAGPVRADAIHTDTTGLTAGEAKVKVADGEMPVYYARPANVQNPPVILVAMEIFGLHEYIKDVTRRLGKPGAFAVAPDYYFRKGVDLTKITEIPQLMPVVNTKPDAELLSDLDATVAWAKSQGGCRVLRHRGRSARAKIALAEESDRAGAGDEGAGTRPLRRGRSGHSAHPGGRDEVGAPRRGKDLRDQDLCRRAARLPRRLSRQLPQGRGRGRLEPDDRLVQEI